MRTANRRADLKFYAAELKSTECRCGRYKKSGHAFCWPCYRRLPRDLQRDLYQSLFEGYPEAYEAAVKYLDD